MQFCMVLGERTEQDIPQGHVGRARQERKEGQLLPQPQLAHLQKAFLGSQRQYVILYQEFLRLVTHDFTQYLGGRGM